MKPLTDESVQLQAQLALDTVKKSQQSLRTQKGSPMLFGFLALTAAVFSFVINMPGLTLTILLGGFGTAFVVSLAYFFWELRQGTPQFYPNRSISPLQAASFGLLVGCASWLWLRAGTILVSTYGQPMNWLWAVLTGVVFWIACVMGMRKIRQSIDGQGVVSASEILAEREASIQFLKEQARHIFIRYTLGWGVVISALLCILPLYVYVKGMPSAANLTWLHVLAVLYLGPFFGTVIGGIRSLFVGQRRYKALQLRRNVAHDR